MVIWVDLDEVLADLMRYLLQKNDYVLWDRRVEFEDISDYYIYKIKELWLTLEDAVSLFRDVMLDDTSDLAIPPVLWVYNKLKKWKSKWYKLKVITARVQDLFEDYTLKWLQKYYPWIFDEVYFSAQNSKQIFVNGVDQTKKSIICQNLGVEVMIEDNPQYALEVASCGIKTYLISKPWNQNYTKHPNLIKVAKFEDIDI